MDADNRLDNVKKILWVTEAVGCARRFGQAVNFDADTLVICTVGIRGGETLCALSLDYTLLIGECQPKGIYRSAPASVSNRGAD